MRRRTALLAVAGVLAGLPVGIPEMAAASSPDPIVTGLAPPAGNPAGGDTITIVGRELAKATSVHFGSAVSTQVTVVSSTKLKVVTPQHALGDVIARVETKDGSESPRTDAARFTYTNPPAPLHWSQPADIDPPSLYSGYAGVSCSTKQVCIADPAALNFADQTAPVMLTNGAWKRVQLPASASGSFTQGLASSCPLPTMCMVVGWSGTESQHSPTAWVWNGNTWSLSLQESTDLSPWRRPVCARGYQYCLVADGNGLVQIYDAGQWTTAAQQFTPISCASDTFCVVLSTTGYAVWNGSTVGPGTEPFGNVSPAISCAIPTFCLAIGQGGTQVLQWTFDGDTWSGVDSPDLAGVTTVPTCLTATSCWLIAFNDGVSRGEHFDGRSWTRAGRVASTKQAYLSCWSPDGCRSVDRLGIIHTLMRDRWHGAQPVPRTGLPTDVSCASSTMCMLVDRAGHAMRFDGTAWQSPQPADIHRQLLSVSCPGDHFCMAVDSRGYAVRWAHGTWQKPTRALSVKQYQAVDVSCASSTFCLTVVQDGRAGVYDGGRWGETPRAVAENGNFLTGVSCTVPRRCVAVGVGVSIYNGRWGKPLAGDRRFSDVSCIGSTCVVTAGEVWIRNGGVLAGTGVSASGRAICATRYFCLIADSREGGSVAVDGASWADAQIPGDYFTAGDCTRHFCLVLTPSSQYLHFQETHATS